MELLLVIERLDQWLVLSWERIFAASGSEHLTHYLCRDLSKIVPSFVLLPLRTTRRSLTCGDFSAMNIDPLRDCREMIVARVAPLRLAMRYVRGHRLAASKRSRTENFRARGDRRSFRHLN